MVSEKVIAATSHSFSKDPYLREHLLEAFPRSVFNLDHQKLTKEALKRFLAGVDGAIVGTDPIDEEVLDSCPRLKCISKYGVGLDNIDQSACRRHGVTIGWTGGVNKLSVAEQTVGFMVSLCRNMYQSSILLKRGTWKKHGGWELSGKTVGVLGLGNIGQEVVRLLQPFRCRILIHDIADRSAVCERYGLEAVDRARLFAEADVLTIHTPLTPETRHMIDLEVLSTMKPGAYLINTSRGGVIRQAHLKEALQKGTLAGAAIDVYEDEPVADQEFLDLPNLFCTPHIGGNSREAVRAMGIKAIEHIQGFYRGN